MNKWINLTTLLLVLVLSMALAGCGQQAQQSSTAANQSTAASEEPKAASEESKAAFEEPKTVSLGNLSVEVPSSWQVKDDGNGKCIYPDYGGLVFLSQYIGEYDGSELGSFYSDLISGLTSDGKTKITSDPSVSKLGDAVEYTADVGYSDGDNDFKGSLVVLVSGEDAYSAVCIVPAGNFESLRADVDKIIGSIALVGATKPIEKTNQAATPEEPAQNDVTSDTEQEPAPADSEPTLSQANALAQAKSYLNYTAFSYSGLIKQLEFEKFSHDDAVYAVDHCGADWNEQAAKMAQSYLDYTSFSREGLIDQLVFEGFSPEQAEYGVSAVGY